MIWVVGACLGSVLLVILVAVVRLGIAAVGTPADRAAACATLREAAGLLGGQYRDRHEYPWHRRPAQYGMVEGDLGDRWYELSVMPWNAEDCGGCAMLRIWPRQGHGLRAGRPELVVFAPERIWHWPDLADPRTLASYARQAISTANSGSLPPGAPPHQI